MTSEWQPVCVGDLGRVVTGKTPKTAIAENYGGSVPFLTPSDDMSVKHVEVTVKKLTTRGLSEVKNCLLPPHSICVSCIGSDLGKVVMTTQETVTNQQINSIIPADNVDANFVYYAMLILGKKLNCISKTSTAVPIVNKSSFSSYTISLPGLEEQRAISAVLSTLDDKIAYNTKINHHLEQMAQAIFKSWFMDFEPFGGVMPDDWWMGTFADVTSSIYSGGTPNTRKEEYWNGNLPWLSSGETRNHFIISTEKSITEEGVNNSSTRLAHRLDVVMASAGQGLTRGQTSLLLFDSYINQSVIVISGAYPFYVFLNLSGRYEELRAISDSSSIRGSLTTKMIAQFPALVPTGTTLQEFSSLVAPLIDQIENNLRESVRLSDIRDTLLPRLISGELSVAEIVAK